MNKLHKNLDAWKKGMELAGEIYRLTRGFPPEEKFGLISQMRRAAASVPANIAEGAARQSKKEFINFLYIAKGSLSEVDTFMDLSRQLGFVKDAPGIEGLMGDVDRIISGLIRTNVARLSISHLPSPISQKL